VVLTIHVVREGGHQYYVHDLVPGRAEGGRVAGEEPGAWWGGGAASLGLSGPVTPAAFAGVLEGRDPDSARALRTTRGDRSVAGYDLTFCAPKSVSLLHLLAPREIAEAAGTGHHRAVADALDYLGREGIGVRRSRQGHVTFLPTTGPVAGGFLHRTSRALDPHLHTHVVVANVAEGVDGVWSGVDGRRLHLHLGAAQSLYHARLRFELGHRMGAAWLLRPSGLADVAGVDPRLCRLFSQRSSSMDEHRHRRGVAGPRAVSSAAVFHADRPDKDPTVTVDALMTEWKQRAADFGFDLGDLTRSVGVHRYEREPAVDRTDLHRRILGLADRHRAIGRRHLVAAVAASTEGGAPVRHVESAAAHLMEACGTPSRVEAATTGGDRWAVEPRWDPHHIARVLTGISPSDLVTGPATEPDRTRARALAPTGGAVISLGAARRRHQFAVPVAASRSLGIER
jgi:conjugative relaxase-like TrwC/TraI family protein